MLNLYPFILFYFLIEIAFCTLFFSEKKKEKQKRKYETDAQANVQTKILGKISLLLI